MPVIVTGSLSRRTHIAMLPSGAPSATTRMGWPQVRGRRSGMTIGSFCCALKRKLQTVKCLTLVGTAGCRVRTAQPNRSCGAFQIKANALTRPSQDGRVGLRRRVALLRFNLFQRPARLTLGGFPKLAISDSMRPHGQEAGMAGIAITRRKLTAMELRGAAGRTKDARAARRMLVIAQVLEGVDRTTAAQTCGMDPQTLRGEEGRETVPRGLFSR